MFITFPITKFRVLPLLLEGSMALNNLILLFLILSPAFPSPLPHSLSKGSSLSVENQEDFLTSPNGLFTAGFHPVGVNAYCFAIWFTKLGLNQTITPVWMANRDNPVNGKLSKLTLRKDGNLILTDANQFVSWETNTASASSLQLFLHNNGNLVLMAKDDNILWQSFDHPTDTLLPGQPLTRYNRLISSRSQSSYSSGFYRFFFDDDNVLRLVFDGPETSSIYWPHPWLLPNEVNRTKYNDTRIAVLDSLGDFQSSDRACIRADDFGVGIQRRLTLDFDGNVRVYSLDKKRRTWVVSGQVIFETCWIHGACGPNSLCIYNHDIGRKCSCLRGFKMKNYTDWSYGCEPEFNLSCKSSEVTFLELPSSDFYGYTMLTLRNATLEECERRCLESCKCKGFQFRFKEDNGVGIYNCYLKRALRNGLSSPTHRGVLRVKLPRTLMAPAHQPAKDFSLDCPTERIELLSRNYQKGHHGSARILLFFASALGGLEVICIVSVWLFLHRSLTDSDGTNENYIQVAIGFRKFSYNELKKATRNFMEEIGRGSSGIVYKGTLCDNRVAAIKRLNEANPNEEEMLAELSIIGRLNHMNLIDVWGYCAEGKHRLLVYEYMECGTLAENLNSNTIIDWKKRFEIAKGTAKGLAYLHEECLEWVLHCDVKPQNILLDSNYQPKVADFGLSKLLQRAGNNDSNFSRIRGTRGYVAPEWIFNLPITSKVDVYSYGIVLLELITGRSPMGARASRNEDQLEQRRLVKWVREKMQEVEGKSGEIQEIIDPNMEGDFDMCKMKKLVNLSLQCAEEDKAARPTMNQVVDALLQIESEE